MKEVKWEEVRQIRKLAPGAELRGKAAIDGSSVEKRKGKDLCVGRPAVRMYIE